MPPPRFTKTVWEPSSIALAGSILRGVENPMPLRLGRDAGEKPIAERQADLFAAYLLMPKNQVMKAFTKVFGDVDTVFEMDFKKRYMLGPIAKRVIDSGSFSNVSLTAMTNRLIGMGLITGISYQKSVMPENINNGIPAYLTRLYRRLKKLIK